MAGEREKRARVQYAALPYRVNGGARPEIMLVTSRETRRWIIPKGWPMERRAPHAAAAREALEEAGVLFIDEKGDPPGATLRKRIPKRHGSS